MESIHTEMNECEKAAKQEKITESLDDELKLYDFSYYPLPAKEKGVARIFYNNINGLEINAAISAKVNNNKEKKRYGLLKEKETYMKVEALIKQLQRWEVNITGLSEPCVEWKDVVPRTVVKEIGKNMIVSGTGQ